MISKFFQYRRGHRKAVGISSLLVYVVSWTWTWTTQCRKCWCFHSWNIL